MIELVQWSNSERAERALLRRPKALAADVLKVSHHGSLGASGESFLRAVAPAEAVVSAPCHPGRGLPHPDVLARLERTGARLRWTGRDGAVIARPRTRPGESGRGFVVEAWAQGRPCPR